MKPNQNKSKSMGIVHIVGAGPGDPSLISIKGHNLLKTADIIFYDRLINTQILKICKKTAQLIYVGKKPYEKPISQTKINKLLLTYAQNGNTVVRLKGGDPFLFGRGAEEAAYLAKNNVPYEVVPGITSAIAVPSYAGIPVTSRKLSSSVMIITGHEEKNKDQPINWKQIACFDGTIVILMANKNLDVIVKKLITHGYNPETLSAITQSGSGPNQKTICGKLSEIVLLSKQNDIRSPSVLMIGNVIKMREQINWYEQKPLFGKNILVTRSPNQSAALSNFLQNEAANVIEIPTIEITPLSDNTTLDFALSHLNKYDWIVFSSTNAVDSIFNRLNILEYDARAFYNTKIAAIGSVTAEQLKKNGISQPDIIVTQSQGSSLIKKFETINIKNNKILIPEPNIGSSLDIKQIERYGAKVKTITAYNNKIPNQSKKKLINTLEKGIDVITFTSRSTVRNFSIMLGKQLELIDTCKIACLGPSTAEEVSKSGIYVDIIPGKHTTKNLVEEIIKYFNK